MDVRKRCAHVGCQTKLTRGNTSGVCKEHIHNSPQCGCRQCKPVSEQHARDARRAARTDTEVTLPVPPWEMQHGA